MLITFGLAVATRSTILITIIAILGRGCLGFRDPSLWNIAVIVSYILRLPLRISLAGLGLCISLTRLGLHVVVLSLGFVVGLVISEIPVPVLGSIIFISTILGFGFCL